MAIKVITTIKIANQAYEGGVKDQDILEEVGFVSSTGSFQVYGRELLGNLVQSSADAAVKSINKKLDAIKGKDES